VEPPKTDKIIKDQKYLHPHLVHLFVAHIHVAHATFVSHSAHVIHFYTIQVNKTAEKPKNQQIINKRRNCNK
jgi:hypothetical protein